MCRIPARVFVVLSLILGLFALATPNGTLSAGGQDKKDKKDQKKDKIDPAKLKPDPKTVEAQKKAAEEYWKEVFEDKAPMAESAHFILVGGKPGTDLPNLASILEQQYAKACKALQLDKEPAPWLGKLTLFLLPDAKKYPHMIRLLQRRKADEDEVASSGSDSMFPHVAACTGKAPGDLGALGNAGVQMSALVLSARAKVPLPVWLNEGFGRATVLHAGAGTALAADRRKASAILNKTARGVDEIFTSTLGPDEQPYLRTSFVDYFAYSGLTAKFIPFIEGFRPDEKGNPGTLETALKKANTTRDNLQTNWHKYAKAFK
jgi:hypothetical protein